MKILNAKWLIFSDSAHLAQFSYKKKIQSGIKIVLQVIQRFHQFSPWEIYCYSKILSVCPEIKNSSRKTRQNLPKTFYIYSLTFVSVPEEVLKTNVSTLEAFNLNSCKI